MSTDETYKNGHRARLRKKLIANGLAIEDSEVLELVIGLAQPRGDTKPLAKALLKRFQSIRGVLDAREEELLELPGFGDTTLSLWILLREVRVRYAESPVRHREVMANPHQVAAMARARLGACPHEEVWAALLDAGNRLVAWLRLDQGTPNASALHVPKLLKLTLQHQATGIVLVHNHPGGTLKPSGADLELTRTLSVSAHTVGVKLLDHIVLTEAAWFSFKDDGLL